MLGYLFALIAMICFGILGIFHKLADRKQCTPFMISVTLFAASTVIMTLGIGLFKGADFAPPGVVIGVAVPFGIITVISLWVFQYGIRFGKITTSWVIINLSAAVPTVASTAIYNEPLGLKKLFVLCLIALAILLLWKDMKEDESRAKQQTSVTPTLGKREDLLLKGE